MLHPKVLVPWQVHGGKLHDGRRFAMKIQYPGVARSIESDVDNLMRLINIANLLPKGLYVEQAAEVRTWVMVHCAHGSPQRVVPTTQRGTNAGC